MNVCCLLDGGLPIRSTAHPRNGRGFTKGGKFSAGTLCMDPFHSTSENRAIIAKAHRFNSEARQKKKRRQGQTLHRREGP